VGATKRRARTAKRGEQAPDAPVSVQEGVDGFELRVCKGALHQDRHPLAGKEILHVQKLLEVV